MLTTLRLVALNRSVMFLAIAVLTISASATFANAVHAQDGLGTEVWSPRVSASLAPS